MQVFAAAAAVDATFPWKSEAALAGCGDAPAGQIERRTVETPVGVRCERVRNAAAQTRLRTW